MVKKRIISFMLAILMLASCIAGIDFSAYSATLSSSGFCGPNVIYSFNSSTGELVISGKGAMSDYASRRVEDGMYSYYTYTTPFFNQSDIRSIVIESGVTSIGDYAFCACRGVRSVTIPDTVTDMGDYAFSDCSNLKTVNINNIESWLNIDFHNGYGNPLYYGSDLYIDNELITFLEIPESISYINSFAFMNCLSLKGVKFPNSLKGIGKSAFYGCTGIKCVYIPTSINLASNTFGSNTKIYYEADKEQRGSCGNDAFFTFEFETGILEIQGSGDMQNYSLSKRPEWELYSMSIREVIITNQINTIGEYVFYDCKNIERVTIQDGVESIGKGAFYNCSGMKNISIPDSIMNIDNGAFSGCTRLTNVIIPNNLTNVADYTFYGCTSLSSVAIGNSVVSIGDYAFSGCSSLASIIIPDSVVSIGEYAFNNCVGLENAIIGNSVSKINAYAFAGSTNLKNVSIGSGVRKIFAYAFSDCRSLKKVNINSVKAWCNIIFGNDQSNPLYYANNLYLNNELVSDLIIPNGITRINYGTFYNCSNLKSVTIPSTVTEIGVFAFKGCTGLKSIIVPDSVNSIDGGAFADCNSLEEMTLPFVGISRGDDGYSTSHFGAIFGGVRSSSSSSNYHYYGYGSLNSTTKYYYTYNIPTSIKKVTITNTSKIPSTAFRSCEYITDIVLMDNVSEIGINAFANCSSLRRITVRNKNCNIYNSSSTIGKKTMLGFTGSTLEAYSKRYGGYFISLDDCEHNYKLLSEISPTCLEQGYSKYICTICSEILKIDYINANGHSFGEYVDDNNATCLDGTKTAICSVCHFRDTITNEGSGAGHTEVTDESVLPTCTSSGLTEGKHCSVCNEVLVPQKVVKAFGHTPSELVSENRVEPTCTEYGYYEEVVYCSVCNVELSRQDRIIDELNHKYTAMVVSPTCTEQGYTTFTCDRGDHEYTADYIDALGHTEAIDEAVEPTCAETGLTEGKHCSACETILIEQESVDSLGHKEKRSLTRATTSKNGKITYTCERCLNTLKEDTTIYYPKTISLSATKYTYDGKVKKPTVKVVDANGKTIAASNYTVTYSSGLKNVGKYTVKITFKGNYSGTVSKTFTIVPKTTSISSLTAASKGFTAKWKKQATQTTGYQIQIATDSKFTKGVKSYTVTKNSTVSKNITKLTGKKKYYVRIRTYKTVSSTKFYSSWSGYKAVTTKK